MPSSTKVSNKLLEQISNSLDLSEDQILKLRTEGLAVGGTRRNTARYFKVGNSKVLPSFSFKGIGENEPTPEMIECRSKVDEVIDMYTITD